MACNKLSMEAILCQICGENMGSSGGHQEKIDYQKQVDPPISPYGNENTAVILPDPVPHSPEFYKSMREPTIVHTSSMEYRVTSDVRGKPANQTGVTYIMNHGFMERADVEAWVKKKKRMAKKNLSWVGDGSYVETRPEMLHFFGNTTHLFLPNPEKPYGNTPPPKPVCHPRDGLDH